MSVRMFHQHMHSLIELKQTGTVVEYTAEFWEHLHRVLDLDSDLNIKSFVDQYVKGLRGDIQAAVRSRSPSSISCASSLARIREDEILKDTVAARIKEDEIVKDKATVADQLGDSGNSYGFTPTETLTDVFSEHAPPVQGRAGHSATAIDTSCLAALAPTTCLAKCRSHGATALTSGTSIATPNSSMTTTDFFPKLSALAKSDGDLDLDMVSVAALTSATCSTDVIAHGLHGNSPAQLVWMTQTRCWNPQGRVLRPAPWPSFIEKRTNTARCGTVEPPRSTDTTSNMAVISGWTLCFEDGLTPMYMLDVNFSIKQQGQVQRPMPWPLVKCHSEAAGSKEPGPATQGECVAGLSVSAVRCSLDHGSDFTTTRTISGELPDKYRLAMTCFCLFMCGIRLWNPGISLLICSIGTLTCTCKRAYFSGRQWKLFYGGLDSDIRLGYQGDMTLMLRSSLFWFASGHIYKVQPGRKYMKLSQDSIARALLELYSSPLGQSDYEIHIASASNMVVMRTKFWTTTLQFARDISAGHFDMQFGVFLQTNRFEIYFPWIQSSTFMWWYSSDTRAGHMWESSITVLSCLQIYVQMFIARLGYEIHQPKETIESAVMLLQKLQPTPQFFAPWFSLRQAKDRVQHCTWYLPSYSRIPTIQYAQVYTYFLCWLRPYGIKQYLPPGRGIAHTQRFSSELGTSNTTKHIYEDDCPFFHHLVINNKIIYMKLLLPYDSGGLAVWLDKIGGIPDTRLFLIGLRASRISREGECNTPAMGRYHMVSNLGLGYEMGRGPTLCGIGRSSISTSLVTRMMTC